MKNIQQNIRVEIVNGKKVSITGYSPRDKSRPYPNGGRGKQKITSIESEMNKNKEEK